LFLDPARTPVRHRTARKTKIVDEKEEEGAWVLADEGGGKIYVRSRDLFMIPFSFSALIQAI
jgi:hypothetical protein